MKKIYAFLITLCIGAISFAQNLVTNGDFENWTTSTTPASWTVANSTTQDATVFYGGANSARQAVTATSKLSQVITGIVAGKTYTISYWYKLDATSTGSGARIWSAFKDAADATITDATSALIIQPTAYLAANGNVWTYKSVNVTAPAGATKILFEFRTYNGAKINWDNMSMVCSDCGSDPALLITSPANATTFNPTISSVSVNISVGNYTVASGAGHIQYTVDGGSTIMKYDTNPIVLNGLTTGAHTVAMSLVDVNHLPLATPVNASVTFNIASISNVANIAALRAGTLNAYYTLSGAAVVSHVRTPAGTVLVATTRNQKFIQDSTGGILIDDSAGKITTPFAVGDIMSNVSGQLINFNGILEFVPLQDQTVVSSGNSLTPENITINALNTNVDNYESKLISFNNITITGTVVAGVVTPLVTGATFAINTNYNVYDGTSNGVLRTGFAEANYIGATIPTGAFNITALGYDNVTTANPPVLTPQFIPRNAADFSVTLLQTQNNEIAGLKVYPNPVSNGVLHVESNLHTERTISIYDVLGKEVMKTTTSNTTLNIANLNSGIYIVKISENGKTATKKLVVK